ncbi:site-specific DNA-methyltransferase [Hoylesella nanceiensis]|uniref:site-specific DNA-methyltransferase n=1 Tax=Hoylesella nanceiensis TaxID=425941 RepID=UPI0028EF4FB9|nr:site-specific DNA-methyltransferase [Hoylesella nanceiensis]
MKPERLERTSVDGSKLNLEALYQIAPSCFTEEKDVKTGAIKHVVNFKTLRQLLGNDAVEDGEEMYQFTWPGKQAARREAAAPITDTLRPMPENSVDWDTTQNLYIEGDNLRVLKLLQKGYMGKVKMIYIDPPYNTGNDFVYHDDFAHSLEEEELAVGNVDEEGNRYRKNLDSNGRFHSDWCSMIYSRLLVARSLLTEDGAIFISIGDDEEANMIKICDEVFGEKNFIASICHKHRASVSNDRIISENHNHLIFYAKDIDTLYQLHKFIGEDPKLEGFDKSDEKGEYKLTPVDGPGGAKKGNPYYEFQGVTGYWRYSKETMQQKYDEGLIVATENNLQQKLYKSQAEKSRRTVTTWWDEDFLTSSATTELQKLMGDKTFDNPKNVNLLLRMLKMITYLDKNAIILDFFSGSATTAHAVMQLNAKDKGHRKYICVQLPEETPEDSEARKAGYATIPEIAKERIRRAGKKIKEESPLTTQDLDTGFRVFRLSGSNYEDVMKQPSEYDQQVLDLFADNIKADRTDLDLLFGAMLSWGVQLSLPMTTEEVDGCKIYTVDGNGLVACFAENITENVVKAMADKQPLRVLFRDSCFAEDKSKINIFELFKQQLDWDESESMQNIRVI